MVSEWVAGGLFLLGSLWAVPAWYLGKANGINHATWRTKQAMHIRMAQAWQEGVTAGLSCDSDRGETFTAPNPYKVQQD